MNITQKCSIDNCNELPVARTLCNKHYKKMWRSSNFVKIKYTPKDCTIHKCHSKYYAKGLCVNHYYMVNRNKSTEYSAWSDMKQRCNNPNNDNYNHYGGRGIKVCKRWNDSFSNFLEDMGERPEGMTLERKNNDGNYEPSNVKWATWHQQNSNRRTNSNHTGISYNKQRCRWSAYLMVNGKRVLQSYHSTKQEAYNARINAERTYGLA